MADATQGSGSEVAKGRDVLRAEEEARWAEERRINELPFAELTTEQKFTRLINCVRSLDYWVNRVQTLETEVNRLKQHSHDNMGDVVIPLSLVDRHNNSLSVGSSLKNRHPLD